MRPEVVFENLLYCINAEPRLFRWNAGTIEWADPVDPCNVNDLPVWHVLPGQAPSPSEPT